MAIQRPNLEKFKKQGSSSNQRQAHSEKKDDGKSEMFMEMGKAFIPMLPKKFQYIVGAAIFFLVWGIISFNYFMINWLDWGYFFSIVAGLAIFQINDEFKIIEMIFKPIKK